MQGRAVSITLDEMISTRIGIIGDFNPKFQTHLAMQPALEDAARRLTITVESRWIPTPALVREDRVAILSEYDGLWAAAASPYDSFEGMLAGIEFARIRQVPFTAT